MELRPAEVTSILKKEIENYDGGGAMQSVGTVLSVGDGVSRVYGLGVALNLEEDNVGACCSASDTQVKEGDEVRPPGADHLGADRRRAARPRGQRAGRPGRRQGRRSATAESDCAPIEQPVAPSVRRAPARDRAAADRHQGHRLDDPDRPRPARADHRRPPDRQDRASCHRHHHQPEDHRRRGSRTPSR